MPPDKKQVQIYGGGAGAGKSKKKDLYGVNSGKEKDGTNRYTGGQSTKKKQVNKEHAEKMQRLRKHENHKQYSKCCTKVAQSKHCGWLAKFWYDSTTFIWNKQTKKFLGIEPATWGKIMLCFIWTICIVCALCIAFCICWPPISNPVDARNGEDYSPVNSQDRLPLAFMHFPSYYTATVKNMVIDISQKGLNGCINKWRDIMDACRTKGRPMAWPAVNWEGKKSRQGGFKISSQKFGPCDGLSTGKMQNLAAQGKICIYLALQRVYPIKAQSIKMECFTRVANKDNELEWKKNARGLKFQIFPPVLNIKKNFFNYDLYSKKDSKYKDFQAPGLAVLVSGIELNNLYVIQCRYQKANKQCPVEFQMGGSLLASSHGGFMAEIGVIGTEADKKKLLNRKFKIYKKPKP